MMKSSQLLKYQHTLIAIALFFLTFLLYIRSQNTHLSDSLWAIHIASSIINSGDINLDEYEQIVNGNGYYGAIRKEINGHILPYFPVGNSILVIPFIWVVEHVKQMPEQQSFYQYLQQTSPRDPYLVSIQHTIASFITALTVPILYMVGYKRFGSTITIMGVLIFAFGTSAYSTSSRVLWQHGPSMLMLTIALALFLKAESDSRAIQWAGIPLAFSFIIRPTNSIPIFILTSIVFLRYRKQLPRYLLGAMGIAILFIWSNQHTYGYFLPPYYMPERIGSSSHFTEALAGNLISPARGLFVFSPIMIFALCGIIAKFKRTRLTLVEGALVAIIGLHWIMISSFGHWWGGHSYGPRFFTDILPFMTYFLLLGLYELNQPAIKARFRQIGMGIFVVLALISIAIHYVGANERAIYAWSIWPLNVDTYPSSRLWDWSDLVFFRDAEDWPLGTLQPTISFDLQKFKTDDFLHIPLQNIAEEEYLWEVKLPSSLQIVQIDGVDYGYAESGIPTVVGEEALMTQAHQWLPIGVERPLASFADSSLGAIMVTAKTLQGEEKSIQIIPVSITNNGRFWRDSDALSEKIWLPSDIDINNGKADFALYGLYGSGWHALESFEQWRWAQSPAELYIFSEKSQSVTLELALNAYDEAHVDGLGNMGRLHISMGEEEWIGQVHVDALNQIPLSLDKGWNTVLFTLEAGNFSPADVDATSADREPLSFLVDSINIVTTD